MVANEEEPQMGEQKQEPGRPRKWASDAERMRATRAAQRAEREAALSPTRPPDVEEPADHADCEVTIGVLRTELVDLEERYDDLVLSRWILAQKYECALGRMNLHDPVGIVWLVEQLAEWEHDVEAKRTKRLQEPNRERARRRYEEEFERRLEQARRAAQQ